MDDLFYLAHWLDVIADDVKDEIEKSAKKGAMEIEGRAKAMCPVDTGYLKNSIQSDANWDGDVCTATIGTNAEYAPMVEYGTGIYAENGQGRQTPWKYKVEGGKYKGWHMTQGQKAKPFLYPALYANKDKVLAEIAEDIKRIFDDYN